MKIKRFVRIIKGEYKGYTGTIVAYENGKYVVRVDANNKIIYLDKEGIAPLDNQNYVELANIKGSIPLSSRTKSSQKSTASKSVSRSQFRSASKTGSRSGSFKEEVRPGNYFKNLEQKLKETQNPYLFDVSEFLQLMDIEASFSGIKEATIIGDIISESELKNKEVKTRLFVIAYFFVQLNRRNMQIPYKLMFKNIVAPNDDYNYILNASLLMKYLQKAQVDTELLEKYINTILGYLNIGLVSYIDRAEVLEKLREKRAQIKFPRNLTPKISPMKFVQRKSSDLKPEFFAKRDNIITGYINDIKSGKITLPANVNKDEVVYKLEKFIGKKINSIDILKEVASPIINENKSSSFKKRNKSSLELGIFLPRMNASSSKKLKISSKTQREKQIEKDPTKAYINSILQSIKIRERQIYRNLKYPDMEKPIKSKIQDKIKNLILSRINAQMIGGKSADILISYANNIENPEYFRNLTNSEKIIVDPYRRYFNLLVENSLSVLPGQLYKKKSNFEQENPVKNKIRDKIINIEKGRLRKLMPYYKDYVPILDILINNYDTIVNMSTKDLKQIDIDKESGFYTDDEMMIKLAQKELYYRLNDVISKNYQNLTFYSNASQERLVNRL